MVNKAATNPSAPRQEDIHAAIGCLQRLADAFHVRRQQLAATVGLTDHQWAVLEEISTEHFMPSMFARRRSSSPAAVSKTLRQIGDRELISVQVSDGDGRQRVYSLTDKGRQIMESLRLHRQEAIDAIWLDMGGQDVRDFVRFGENLTERLENFARDKQAQGGAAQDLKSDKDT